MAASLVLPLAVVLAAASPFDDARTRYEALDYEHACPLFDDAARAAADAGERGRALVWAGLCRGQLGDVDGARARFHDALAAAPDVALPPDAPPKVVALFAAERAARRARKTAPATAPQPVEAPAPAATPPAARTAVPTTALWATGGVLAAAAAGALIAAAVEGSAAAAADAKLQDARRDPAKTGPEVTALTRARDGPALAANVAFAVAALAAAGGAAALTAAFFVE